MANKSKESSKESKGDEQKEDHEQHWATDGEVLLGGEGVESDSNNVSSSQSSGFEDNDWVLDASASNAHNPRNTDSEDQGQHIVDWNFLVKFTANQAADADNVANNSKKHDAWIHDQMVNGEGESARGLWIEGHLFAPHAEERDEGSDRQLD